MASANAAIDACHLKKEVDGQTLIVNKHISKHENEHSIHKTPPILQNQISNLASNLYVKFIPKNVTQDELRKVFEKLGKIISIKLEDFVQKSSSGEQYVNF